MSDKIELLSVSHDEREIRRAAVEAALELMRANALSHGINLENNLGALNGYADLIESALVVRKAAG